MEHDIDYTVGGNEEDRFRADRDFYFCMIEWKVPLPIAKSRYLAVREFGGPSFQYGPSTTKPQREKWE
jgi:hypothetical protein